MQKALTEAFSQISDRFEYVLAVDLLEDQYQLLHSRHHLVGGEQQDEQCMDERHMEDRGAFSDFLAKEFSRESLFSEDRNSVEKYGNLSYFRSFFEKCDAKEHYWIRYRRKEGEEYHPIRLEAFSAKGFSSQNQKVYVFVMDLNGTMYQENSYVEELLRSLSENYESIYFVDFEKDTIIPYRMSKVIEENFGDYFRTFPSYENAMTGYVKRRVAQKDLQEMLELAKTDYIRALLFGKKAYAHEYHVISDGEERCFRYKITNVDGVGECKRAVVGFADVTSEKQSKINYSKSMKKTMIVANDVETMRELSKILGQSGGIIRTENGREAMEALEYSYEEIAVVITELKMPELNGYDLIQLMKRNKKYKDIPIIVCATKDLVDEDEKIEVKCMELGAADFIIQPFIPSVVINRVSSLIRLRESTAMLNSLEKDSLTGLYNKVFFFKKVEEYLFEHPTQKYMMWVSDIQGLKVINDKYGLEKGDGVLKVMAEYWVRNTPGFLFGGRIEGDKFAGLLRDMDFEELESIILRNDSQTPFPVPNVVIKHGIYRIERKIDITPQGMYDRAMLALQKIKSKYGVFVAEYNDELRKDLLLRQMILGSADEALAKGEFTVFYQPKHDFRTGKTSGAEGLVRWKLPEFDFLSPNVFIPLFEQNGFISKLDFYVWELVCKTIKKWESDGIPVVPVSINVSRRDFEVDQLAEKIISLVDRYQLAHHMIHIEVTESAYSDDPERIKRVVGKLHDEGFVIELDDFGTGYSSLIALSSMDLDILKLDRSIIQNDMPGSEKNILEFSMQLAKMLHLKTVAEGVETKEQMERVSQLGGDYIQGYYYSKPLPANEFAQYLVSKNS